MSKVMVTAPTASIKDYALYSWLLSYKNLISLSEKSLYLVDTTAGTTDYAEKLDSIVGRENVSHVENPDVNHWNLVHIVSHAWNSILSEARRREVDWIFSVEIDIYLPRDAYAIMSYAGEYTGSCLVTHGYPYPMLDRPLHSVGCMLIDPSIFSDDQKFYVDGNTQFEDEVWSSAYRSGRGILRMDNVFKITHDDSVEEDGYHRF